MGAPYLLVRSILSFSIKLKPVHWLQQKTPLKAVKPEKTGS